MNVRVYIALFLSGFAFAAFGEYGFEYSADDIPNSSIYQMLYKPQVKEDVPFTSIYSEIYSDTYDDLEDTDQEAANSGSNLWSMQTAGDFDTAFASNFSVGRDFMGTAKWTGNPQRYREKVLRCDGGYISERLDPETLSIIRSCAGMELGELDATSGNAFLANSSDRTLKKFGDANSFVQAMNADNRRMDMLRAGARSNRSADEGVNGMMFSDDMLALLERFAASSPGLRDVVDEAIATGNYKAIYHRIQQAGGLEGLMSPDQQGQGSSQLYGGDDSNY